MHKIHPASAPVEKNMGKSSSDDKRFEVRLGNQSGFIFSGSKLKVRDTVKLFNKPASGTTQSWLIKQEVYYPKSKE